jgi:hypothetical protein
MTKKVQNLQIDPATIRRYVEENFSIERMATEYVGLYEDAIRTHNSERAA